MLDLLYRVAAATPTPVVPTPTTPSPSTSLDFFSTIMWPFKWIVEAILVFWHWILTSLGLLLLLTAQLLGHARDEEGNQRRRQGEAQPHAVDLQRGALERRQGERVVPHQHQRVAQQRQPGQGRDGDKPVELKLAHAVSLVVSLLIVCCVLVWPD